MMKFATHGNGNGLDDLYVLPESTAECQAIADWLRENKIPSQLGYSDVEGQDWFGKSFFDLPFGERHRPQLENLEV